MVITPDRAEKLSVDWKIFSRIVTIPFARAVICQPTMMAMTEMINNKQTRQVSAAAMREIFRFSSHRHKGRNNADRIAAIHIGTKRFFAKYKPANARNKIASFLITETSVKEFMRFFLWLIQHFKKNDSELLERFIRALR